MIKFSTWLSIYFHSKSSTLGTGRKRLEWIKRVAVHWQELRGRERGYQFEHQLLVHSHSSCFISSNCCLSTGPHPVMPKLVSCPPQSQTKPFLLFASPVLATAFPRSSDSIYFCPISSKVIFLYCFVFWCGWVLYFHRLFLSVLCRPKASLLVLFCRDSCPLTVTFNTLSLQARQ